MLFNSYEFAVFFMIVFGLYLALDHKWQNHMLLFASYVFYGAWDWRFLSLILLSTVIDYFCGLKIFYEKRSKLRKQFLFISIFANLGILGFFKYFNFFALSLKDLFGYFGIFIQPHFLDIILPVGISFYTFQTMSYSIDIYRNELEPTRKFFDFALFVAFFPQLVAGPIERAKRLLPQILSPRILTWDKFWEGCYLIFWGLFLKIFVADNLARIVDPVFAQSPPYVGVEVLISLYAFAFQIFCDFAGYSNIARGIGKCLGFNIMVNFNLPYFSKNPRDFWRRWHISLSTWLRDYLYISLGGNRRGKLKTYRNLGITMLLGGIWHGAAWTFVLWGVYQGVLLIVHRLVEPGLKKINFLKSLLAKKVWNYAKIGIFFHLICLGWLIFRAQSVTQIFEMLKSLFIDFGITETGEIHTMLIKLAAGLFILIFVQIFQYIKNDLLAIYHWPLPLTAGIISIMFYLMAIYSVPGYEFIYFQF